MKKSVFALAALAATGLASCNSDETVDLADKSAIAFNGVFVENSTRANDLNAGNISDFGVYGSVTANGTSGMIFNNTKVYKPENGTTFQYDNIQYWIAAAQYDFVAIAPFSNAAWTYAPTATTAAQNGTITFDNSVAGANQDLLFAYTQPEKTPDAITSQPDAVGFNFSHLLSRVMFTFSNGFASGSNITLKVTNVNITNAYAKGTLPVANGTAGDWTASDNTLNIAFGNAGIEALAENGGNAATEHFYMIPAAGTYNVTFDVELIQAGVSVAKYTGRTATLTLNEMQKGYSYNIKAELTADNVSENKLYPIEFTVASVAEWAGFDDVNGTVTK